ncbi:carboxymuconolactone decarboxylase family protein [Chitinophaga solisilvae]|uniref:carboxymuconolactone decarboxylase family protein n=1 Tax=Chitinophaga solisilvae TaxID=1233460 RepID=UPI00136DF547|nr:carboxymuconolactone decarboxylase family protein [Chitinophaga solisilvae]
MEERFLLKQVQPAAFKAMLALEEYLAATDISPLHMEMIRVRASQLNGCAYCLDKHSQDALTAGETAQRLYLLPVWKESPQFSEAERIILTMVEEITHISKAGLTDGTYAKALAQFGQETTTQLIMAVVTINAWNRIGISSRRIPGQHH